MTKAARLLGPVVALGLAFPVLAGKPASADDLHKVWAVRNAKVLVTPLRPPLEKATVVIRDGLIAAVGVDIPVPAEAEVIDGAKLTVYPGFIDALGSSLLKLPEEKFDPSKIYSGEYTDKDRGLTPGLKAFDYVNLGKSTVEKYQKLGLLACHVLPERGILTGQASAFTIGPADKDQALLLKDTWLGIGFSPAGLAVYPGSLMGAVAYLRQAFSDAASFDAGLGRWRKEMKGLRRPDYDARLETLSAFLQGRKPVVFLCRNQYDIERALVMAGENKLAYFIADLGSEGWRVIPELQKAKARLLVTVSFKAPLTSVFTKTGKADREKAEKEIYPKNPAKLAEAGIPFAFSSLGTDDPKSFLEGVGKAVEAGLPRERALEALTAAPAAFLGLDRALGTIEPGKIANLVVAEADLLSKDPKVRYVFADGERVELKESKAKEGEKPTVNITGRWEMAAEGIPKLTVDFLQEEAGFSGKMTTPFGVFDFTGGTVSANEIYFEMNLSVGGQQIELYISAAVEGETMKGTIVQGTQGSAEFTAKRIPG